jgi:hypothetical protein
VKGPRSVRTVEALGRVRLSPNFFMREFLYSEVAAVEGIRNLPSDPDLAVTAGRALCEHLLEPLVANFGRVSIRSAYRSPEVNEFGNTHFKNCGNTPFNRSRHIWDQRDADGCMGAMATIVLPWLVDRVAACGSWTEMAWWIHDHLPYSELQFFPRLSAFNIGWHERPKRRISSFVAPRGVLTKPGYDNHGGNHRDLYPAYPRVT